MEETTRLYAGTSSLSWLSSTSYKLPYREKNSGGIMPLSHCFGSRCRSTMGHTSARDEETLLIIRATSGRGKHDTG